MYPIHWGLFQDYTDHFQFMIGCQGCQVEISSCFKPCLTILIPCYTVSLFNLVSFLVDKYIIKKYKNPICREMHVLRRSIVKNIILTKIVTFFKQGLSFSGLAPWVLSYFGQIDFITSSFS